MSGAVALQQAGARPCATRQQLRPAPAAAGSAAFRPVAALRPAAGVPPTQRQQLGGQQLAAAPPLQRRQQCRRATVRTAAMFDGLSRSLEKAWDGVRKDGKLTADNIKEPMREIRWVLRRRMTSSLARSLVECRGCNNAVW